MSEWEVTDQHGTTVRVEAESEEDALDEAFSTGELDAESDDDLTVEQA